VLANVVAFAPWDWDNHKVLVYWFLAVAIAAAAALVWLWSRWRHALARGALVLVIATMVASGVLEDVTQALGESTYRMLDAEQVELGELVAERTPPKAVFLTGMANHDPVQMIAGRTLYVGYANWLWAEGVPYVPRQNIALEILRWDTRAAALLAASPIDFVVIGPAERTRLGAVEDAFRARFPIALQTASYRVYDVRSARSKSP
jgi:branched-subunit amino acid ABC-type transport system permease component